MGRKLLLGLAGGGLLLTGTLFVLVGCGGGGGPIVPPGSGSGQPPQSAVEKAYQALLAQLPDQAGATAVGNQTCLGCHAPGGAAPVHIDLTAWQGTKHAQNNIQCEQCHGLGSNHAIQHKPAATSLLTPPLIANAVVCGRCHGPTYAQFKESLHAEVAEHAVQSGGVCDRCHVGPLRADVVDNHDELEIGNPTPDQIDAALTTITSDPAKLQPYVDANNESPTCVNCHDAMRVTGNLTWEGQERQLLRHPGNTDDSVVGVPNTPNKLIITFDHTCAACHMSGTSKTADGSDATLKSENSRGNQHEGPQYYMLSGHGGAETITSGTFPNGTALPSPPVVRNTAHFQIPGQCSHCHMPNADHTMTVKLDVSCQPCHTATDAAARRLAIQSQTQQALTALRNRMELWAQAKFGNPVLWNYSGLLDPGTPQPVIDQSTAINKLDPTNAGGIPYEVRRARHNYIDIVIDNSFGVHNSAYTRYLLDIANKNLDYLQVPTKAVSRLTPAQAAAELKAERERARHASMTDL